MRKLIAVLCSTALVAVAGQAVAQSSMKSDTMKSDSMKSDSMKSDKMASKDSMKMDANGDGMVSQDEFMKFHTAMWGKIKKNDKGMAMMADVNMVYGNMGVVRP